MKGKDSVRGPEVMGQRRSVAQASSKIEIGRRMKHSCLRCEQLLDLKGHLGRKASDHSPSGFPLNQFCS